MFARPTGKVKGYALHVMTASGAVVAMLSMQAIFDGRVREARKSDNPYDKWDQEELWEAWKQGWEEAQRDRKHRVNSASMSGA